MSEGEPPTKKVKTSTLVDRLLARRNNVAKSILEFKFNKKRVRVLSAISDVPKDSNGILYWMFRDARVQDNWAFLFAQKLALKNKVPLHVCFCILPKFLDATVRHYKFLIEALEEVANDCENLNINFHLLKGYPNNAVLDLMKQRKMGALVMDFFPLRDPMSWVNDLVKNLSSDIPVCQVDAHNIVPCWVTSNKQEYAARTIRGKINGKLDEYLTEFPPIIKHPYDSNSKIDKLNWKDCLNDVKIDHTVDKVEWCKPGYKAGIEYLEGFIANRLKIYHDKRNDPCADGCSNLSPWFHFGMISVQRVILEVREYRQKYKESVASFMEEAIIRRELSDNFCFYNENYDKLSGAPSWAIESLNQHRKDKREYVYTLEEFEQSQTHDDLWNAAQNQLRETGKLHGFLRMYWAKKILEWTKTPEEALQWSIYFNDKYAMDGRDPNGYVGCMWSICGVHDQGWKERDIFGKIRFMNYKGCERKFDVKEFVRKYKGKVVSKSDISKILDKQSRKKK